MVSRNREVVVTQAHNPCLQLRLRLESAQLMIYYHVPRQAWRDGRKDWASRPWEAPFEELGEPSRKVVREGEENKKQTPQTNN